MVAAAMMGAGHFSPEDSSVGLKLGFAVQHKVTKVDAILLSKALEAKIEYMAKKSKREQNIYATRGFPGHRDVKIDKRIYIYGSGLKRGTFAAERSNERVVTYEGLKYLLTKDQYKEYERYKKKYKKWNS